MIQLAYPKAADKAPDATYDDIIDPVLSGKFIITAIKHIFNAERHMMRMEICKNGLAIGTGPEDEVVDF